MRTRKSAPYSAHAFFLTIIAISLLVVVSWGTRGSGERRSLHPPLGKRAVTPEVSEWTRASAEELEVLYTPYNIRCFPYHLTDGIKLPGV